RTNAGFRKIGRRADITAQPWLWLGWVWRYNLFVISVADANLHKISYAIRGQTNIDLFAPVA
ncbi:MAG: hypothetical protein SVV80_09705, partial [Planctomycetota bacterium]|nr:hypothetical protein [Planctomycetota bacterium]